MRRMITPMILLLSLILAACTGSSGADSQNKTKGQTGSQTSKEAAELYREIYEQAVKDKTLADLNTVEKITDRLGEAGFTAVDMKNQLNMRNSEQAEKFAAEVKRKEASELTILAVLDDGGFIRYDLRTKSGKVKVISTPLSWHDGRPKEGRAEKYTAADWKYTDSGYLFFKQRRSPDFDGLTVYTALRVRPLDEKYRKLNRKYILPAGYGPHNMFTSDWSEDDFKELSFNDLYETLYQMKYGQQSSCEVTSTGKNYDLPEKDFEGVLQAFFKIDSKTLRRKTKYSAETKTYHYRTRGIYESPVTADLPFPEVTDYKENKDGTVMLTVNAVWPEKNSDRAFSHKVVIRPLSGNSFQYVSNTVVPSDKNIVPRWNADSAAYKKGYDLPIHSNEKKEAESECIQAMCEIKEIYGDSGKVNTVNAVISRAAAGKMQTVLGKKGCPVSASGFHLNMINNKKMEKFLKDAVSGKNTEITVYELLNDGGISRAKYSFDGSDMYILNTNASWNENYRPSITLTSLSRIKEWRYTKKGWFIYELCVPEPPKVTEVINGNTMLRVKPQKKEYIDIALKYLYPVSYRSSLLKSNWSVGHFENMDFNRLFQYLYSLKYNKNLDPDKYAQGIPKKIFEAMMTEYMPVTAEQLKQYAVYDSDTGIYKWEALGCGNYAPNEFDTSEPEITDIKYNKDGTAVLTVDAVCEAAGSDALMSHRLTVRFGNGREIRFLGNQILENN